MKYLNNPKTAALAFIVLAILLVDLAKFAQDVSIDLVYRSAINNIDLKDIPSRGTTARKLFLEGYFDKSSEQYKWQVTYRLWAIVVTKYLLQILAIYFCAVRLASRFNRAT